MKSEILMSNFKSGQIFSILIYNFEAQNMLVVFSSTINLFSGFVLNQECSYDNVDKKSSVYI